MYFVKAVRFNDGNSVKQFTRIVTIPETLHVYQLASFTMTCMQYMCVAVRQSNKDYQLELALYVHFHGASNCNS